MQRTINDAARQTHGELCRVQSSGVLLDYQALGGSHFVERSAGDNQRAVLGSIRLNTKDGRQSVDLCLRKTKYRAHCIFCCYPCKCFQKGRFQSNVRLVLLTEVDKIALYLCIHTLSLFPFTPPPKLIFIYHPRFILK